MRHLLMSIVFCSLAACASAPPEQYQRGTLAPPPPAPHRPGVGLHIPGQPGRKPDVQPQPRPKRYLPPEPDGRQGIWAAKAPADDPALFLLGMLVPHSHDLLDVDHGRECATALQAAIDDIGFSKRIARATNEQRYCAVATLFAGCVERRAMAAEAAHASHISYETEREHLLLSRLHVLAQLEVELGCKNVHLGDEVWKAFAEIWDDAEAIIKRRRLQ